MDIIIKNGVIQKEEAKRIHEIKNEEGLLKKDFSNYIKGVPGPYYDFLNCHICIPRKCNNIMNFFGPQKINKIKLLQTNNYNEKISYCSICHQEMKPNPAFSSKRKVFIEEDIYERKRETNKIVKENEMNKVIQNFKKIKVTNYFEKQEILNKLTYNINNFSEININSINYWIIYFKKMQCLFRTQNLKEYKLRYNRIIHNYYMFVYKLIKQPILYPISQTETRILWPWELTKYQKFRLNNMDYKNTAMFSHNRNKRINECFVMIE